MPQLKDVSPAFIVEGRMLHKEDTAEALNLKELQELYAFGQGKSKFKALEWKRFTCDENGFGNDYYRDGSASRCDAL
jgi:hypothetical protein